MYCSRGHEKWHATILAVKSSNVLENNNNNQSTYYHIAHANDAVGWEPLSAGEVWVAVQPNSHATFCFPDNNFKLVYWKYHPNKSFNKF